MHFNINVDWPGNLVHSSLNNNSKAPQNNFAKSSSGEVASASSKHHQNLIEYLTEELIQLILTLPNPVVGNDISDVRYLAAELLIILISSSVYHKQPQYLVMMYLFRTCSLELQHAFHHPMIGGILSECLAVKLVTTLHIHSTSSGKIIFLIWLITQR